jgi:hypothetical protein
MYDDITALPMARQQPKANTKRGFQLALAGVRYLLTEEASREMDEHAGALTSAIMALGRRLERCWPTLSSPVDE